MYTHILFDLDGTISDPKEGITKSVQYALGFFGIVEENSDKLEPFIGPPLKDSFMEFYGMDEKKALEAMEKYRERFAVYGLYENYLYPGMKEMLEGLCRDGFHLAVASSKPEPFVEKILEYFQIRQYFEVVTGSGLDGSLGTKEAVVQEALRRLFGEGRKPLDTTVMVGDRKFDVTGARAMSLRSVGVTYGYAQPGEMEACCPDALAHSVEELNRILRGVCV